MALSVALVAVSAWCGGSTSSEHLQQVAAISLRSPSDLLKSPFFRSFAVCRPVASLWCSLGGFAVKGVTLYPGIFARPLLALWLACLGVRSLGCISEHATAFRSHSLPAPLPVLHLPCLHGMPLQLHTMPILAVFGFSWVLLRLGAQTARPAVCGCRLMPLKVAAACIMHHLAFSAHCPAVSFSRILSGKPPASSLSALLGKLPGI